MGVMRVVPGYMHLDLRVSMELLMPVVSLPHMQSLGS